MKNFRKIKKHIARNWQEILLGFFVVLFFVLTSSFLYTTQSYSTDLQNEADFVKWASPDETANYIFAKLYAQEGRISLEEKYNLQVEDVMRPRSFRSDNGSLKPVSFLGIILIYGKIASFFSYKIIPYLTPFFASIGIVFFYLLVKRLFGRNNAFLSSMILVFFPPFVYYTARSMFHNVLFTILLIIASYFTLLMGEKVAKYRKGETLKWKHIAVYVHAAMAGLVFGLLIMTRTSELLWLLPLLFVLWVANIRRVGFIKLVIFVVFLILATSPMFYYNNILYGSYFSGGYPQMNQSIQTLASAGTDIVSTGIKGGGSMIAEKIKLIKNTIFHFGYDPIQSRAMFDAYFIKMFPYIFWPALVGLAWFLIRANKQKYARFVYLLAYLIISFILVVYYGSWVFHDNPDLEAVTIGNSYTRYWLPVYLGALPFVSLIIMKLTRVFCLLINKQIEDKEDDSEEVVEEGQGTLFDDDSEKLFCRNFLRIILIAGLAIVSIKFVMTGSEEGLKYSVQNAAASQAEWRAVLSLTENNSVIVTRYHDKLFFPERKVIVGLFDDIAMNDRYAKLAKDLPVYYYNFSLGEDDIAYLNNRRLAESGLKIELVKNITDTFSLYSLHLAE